MELDFDLWSEAGAAKGLHKARLLREIVTELTQAYERAIVEWRAMNEGTPPAT